MTLHVYKGALKRLGNVEEGRNGRKYCRILIGEEWFTVWGEKLDLLKGLSEEDNLVVTFRKSESLTSPGTVYKNVVNLVKENSVGVAEETIVSKPVETADLKSERLLVTVLSQFEDLRQEVVSIKDCQREILQGLKELPSLCERFRKALEPYNEEAMKVIARKFEKIPLQE